MCYRYFLHFIIFLILSGRAWTQERDSIMLYNGQVLIGDIKGVQLGVLSIDDIDMNVLQIKLYKIKSLNSSGRFRIETSSRKIFYGKLKRSPKHGWVNILSDDSAMIETFIQDLNLVIALEKKFFARLDGNLSAGFSYTKSSAAGQTNTSLVVNYGSRKLEYQLSISINGSIDSSGFSRDREDGSLFAAFSVTSSWFIASSFDYQRNLELSIARRYQQLVGGGNKLFVRKNWQLLVLTGLTFNQEKSTSGESSGNLLEIPFITRFNFFNYHHPNMQISSSQSLYYSLSQKNRIRYAGNTSFSWELIKDFNLGISPYTNYDSQPPDGNSNIDYGVVMSISYKF